MKNEPRDVQLSVIIPCYNHSKYILQCLKSIPDSFSGVFEIIFCDDSSQDGSYEMAELFFNMKLDSKEVFNYFCLKNDSNMGVCATLNRCLSYATGDFTYIVASDDFLLPGSLDRALSNLIEKGVDGLISDCVVVDESNKVLFDSALFEFRHSSKKLLSSDKLSDEIVMNWTIPGPSLILKRSVYNDVGLYDESLMAEDRDFYLRLLASKLVVFSENKIACYRIHSRNAFLSDKFSLHIHKEQSKVNYKHHNLFSGRKRLFLMTFYIDYKFGKFFLMRFFRKVMYHTFRVFNV